MSPSTIYEMKLDVNSILVRIVPNGSQVSSSNELSAQISRALRDLFDKVGGIITVLSVEKDHVKVSWKDDSGRGPLPGIVRLLERGKYNEAVVLLEFFKSARPDEPDLLYNLGMAYSDIGELDRALENLRGLIELDPGNVNGRVALGVALARQGQDRDAVTELRRAVQEDPTNPWAQNNLGGCLLRLGEYQDALEHLKQSTILSPRDVRSWYGMGVAYQQLGNMEEADAAYIKVLEIDDTGEVAEQARQARSKIAQSTFRSATPSIERMDAVMYCLGALEKYADMPPDKVRQIGFEIAMLGMNGIDVNDPTKKYQLRSLPGSYTGLHLVCLEYVAFKQFAPDKSIGFDLSAEYSLAQDLFEQRKNQGL